MYDRTAAIGLLDGQPRQFGSVAMSYNDIAAAGQLPLLAQCGRRSLEIVRGRPRCRRVPLPAQCGGDGDAVRKHAGCRKVEQLLRRRGIRGGSAQGEMGRDGPRWAEIAVGCSGRGGRFRGRGQCQSLRVDGVWISLVPTSYAMT